MTLDNVPSMSLYPSINTAPIMCLQSSTIARLSTLLDSEKILLSDEKFQRDWRGLAQIAGISRQKVMQISRDLNRTHQVLLSWITGSLGELQSALKKIDRWDVLDETAEMFETDARAYLEAEQQGIKHVPALTLKVEADFITMDDVVRFKNGYGPQIYDAFLLYVDQDADFAKEICDRMEGYGLKLCVKDRDFLGGLNIELEVMRKMIMNRCNRMVFVISPEFLQNESMKYYLNFAQSFGIERKQRKVVPCVYKPLNGDIPIELSYYYRLHYNQDQQKSMYNFWEKLRDSIKSSNEIASNTQVLKELPPAEQQEEIESIEGKECPPLRETVPSVTELFERIEKYQDNSSSPSVKPPLSEKLQPPKCKNSVGKKKTNFIKNFFKRGGKVRKMLVAA